MNLRVYTTAEVDRALAGLRTHPSAIVRHRVRVLAHELERLRQDNEHLRTEKAQVWSWINAGPIWRRIRDWFTLRVLRRVTP